MRLNRNEPSDDSGAVEPASDPSHGQSGRFPDASPAGRREAAWAESPADIDHLDGQPRLARFSVQNRVRPEKVYDAFYKLSDPMQQIQAYVEQVILGYGTTSGLRSLCN